MPPAVAALPRDAEDRPIPWVQAVVDGVPNFKRLDEAKRREAISNRLCGVCGERLRYWIWFLGGVASFATRMFNDPAMHEECARYSLESCPWLATPKQPIGLGRTRDYEPWVVRGESSVIKGKKRGTLVLHAAPFRAVEWRVPEQEQEQEGAT